MDTHLTAITSSISECEVQANSQEVVSKLWFKSEPLTAEFCDNVTQIQLYTESRDQGRVDRPDLGSWSWFEIAVYPDYAATEPIVRQGDGAWAAMSWKSHHNILAVEEYGRHSGRVFDRGHELFSKLKV